MKRTAIYVSQQKFQGIIAQIQNFPKHIGLWTDILSNSQEPYPTAKVMLCVLFVFFLGSFPSERTNGVMIIYIP